MPKNSAHIRNFFTGPADSSARHGASRPLWLGKVCASDGCVARGARMKPLLLAGLAAGAAIPASGLSLLYRRDMNAARVRLAAVDRHVVSTRWGVVEYAERGYGNPVLVVHGIFHNCVGGLHSVRDLLP